MSSPWPWSKITVAAAISLLVGAATGCATSAGTAPADLHPPTQVEKAAALIRPAIVSINMSLSGYVLDELGNVFNDGNPYEITATCTGFGVNPDGYIATAGHCVDIGPGLHSFRDSYIQMAAVEAHNRRPQVSAEEFYEFGTKNWTVEGATKGSPLDLQTTVQLGRGQADPLPARLVDYRALGQGDVALLKVEAHEVASVEFTTDSDVRIGDQVMAVGYPASTDTVTDPSAEPSNKEGAISSKKTQDSVPVYEISAAVSPGMSGGPTVGIDGRVIGVNSFTIRGESQPFNFIAPAAGLSELLQRNGVQPALSAVDNAYRAGLTAFYAGEYSAAIADFDKVLALSPNHAKAGELKTSAAQQRDKFGDWGTPRADTTRWYLIGGGAGVVLLGAILALILVLRRRRPARSPAVPPTTPSTGPEANPAPGSSSGRGEPMTIGIGTAQQGNEQTIPSYAGTTTAQLPHAFCGACGTRVEPGNKFCHTCGRAL